MESLHRLSNTFIERYEPGLNTSKRKEETKEKATEETARPDEVAEALLSMAPLTPQSPCSGPSGVHAVGQHEPRIHYESHCELDRLSILRGTKLRRGRFLGPLTQALGGLSRLLSIFASTLPSDRTPEQHSSSNISFPKSRLL